MSWICPKCDRQFARKCWHSCVVHSLDDHLGKASPEIRTAFETVVEQLQQCGHLRIDPVKTSISLACRKFFASVLVRKKSLQIDFIAPQHIDSSRLLKCTLGQKNYYCSVRIRSPDNVDAELLNWLKQAMMLAS